MTLTAKQQRFIDEYLVDLNATQAAIRTGYSGKTAYSIGQENLTKPEIAAAIAARQDVISEKLNITQEQVLERWWQIATADPNDIIQFRRTCCRYCHGKNHRYQWRDQEEFAAALLAFNQRSESDDGAGKKVAETAPSDDGEYGYHRLADPSPACPQCFGEGVAEIHATDTRKLPAGAKPLFAGVKETQSGFEVKMQDQGKALENVARHLGMFVDRVEHGVTADFAAIIAARRSKVAGLGDGDEA